MKNLLIISPYFPPANTPDLQRVRMSLPYFAEFGWNAEVVACHPSFYDKKLDALSLKSIPEIKVHHVGAFDKKFTSKIGLGSIALRSLLFYKKYVDNLLRERRFDLIYFSTTQFPVCILGAYWKKKFNVPYVIDMQDPWHTDYYKNKPKHERPPKYWFSYRLNKFLEPIAIKNANGIISVAKKYLVDLNRRYPDIKKQNQKVITFGYSDIDLEIAKNIKINANLENTILYFGVLGPMMYKSLDLFFRNLPEKLRKDYLMSFKGTSYTNSEKANKSTAYFVNKYNLTNVKEECERSTLYHVIGELSKAKGLLIVGTDDAGYTASKLYPYLQVKKPILAILHPESSANEILAQTSNAIIINLDDTDNLIRQKLNSFVQMIEDGSFQTYNKNLIEFSAKELTKKQCELFDNAINVDTN